VITIIFDTEVALLFPMPLTPLHPHLKALNRF